MNSHSPEHDSDPVIPEGQDVWIPGFDDMARQYRSRLKPGGPIVDQSLLHNLATNSLTGEVRGEVRQKIQTWLTWHEAFWTIKASLDLADTDQ